MLESSLRGGRCRRWRVRHWQSHRHIDQWLYRGGKSFPISYLRSFGTVAAVIVRFGLS